MKDPIIDVEESRSSLKDSSTLRSTTLRMVAHVSAILLPSIIIYYAVHEYNLFSLHPTFMILGCSLLMFEGIVIFSKDSSLFPSMSRLTKRSVHYWLVGIGVASVSLGLAAIYIHKERLGKNHYTTWHGLIGVITVGYLLAQSLGGVVLKYHKFLANMIKVKLLDMKLYHATSGLMAYFFVTITLILALQSNWASNSIPWFLWYVCFACVSATALVVSTHITTTYLPIATGSQSSSVRTNENRS